MYRPRRTTLGTPCRFASGWDRSDTRGTTRKKVGRLIGGARGDELSETRGANVGGRFSYKALLRGRSLISPPRIDLSKPPWSLPPRACSGQSCRGAHCNNTCGRELHLLLFWRKLPAVLERSVALVEHFFHVQHFRLLLFLFDGFSAFGDRGMILGSGICA